MGGPARWCPVPGSIPRRYPRLDSRSEPTPGLGRHVHRARGATTPATLPSPRAVVTPTNYGSIGDLHRAFVLAETNESQVTDLDFLVASHVCTQRGRRIFAHELAVQTTRLLHKRPVRKGICYRSGRSSFVIVVYLQLNSYQNDGISTENPHNIDHEKLQ